MSSSAHPEPRLSLGRLTEAHRGARILVVDDELYVRELIARWLGISGYRCETVADGMQALEVLGNGPFELVISDITMPGMSGIELLESIRERHREVAVIMATAISDRETAVRTLELGAFGYLIKPLDENDVLINVANALERRRLRLLDRDYQVHLEEEVRERTEEIRRAREEISLLLVTASEYRDMDTGLHVRRMGLYAEAMARALGWSRQEIDDMRLAAPMHDVGKIAVPDRILLKPGRLTAAEFEIVKQHTRIGCEILGGSDIGLLRLASEIAGAHHERWDGRGYPEGRGGESIPAAARLVSIIDVYDALVHDRVYRPALSEDETIDIMKQGRGRHFDPEMFDVFLRMLPEFRKIREGAEVGTGRR